MRWLRQVNKANSSLFTYSLLSLAKIQNSRAVFKANLK